MMRAEIELHHIVDPRTESVHTCWRTVSVAAPTCLDANVASTAAIVLGPGAVDWLASRQLSARLVRPDGTVQKTAGWPDETASPEYPQTHLREKELCN